MTRKNRAAGFYSNRVSFFLFIVLVLIIAGCSANVDVGNNVNANPVAYETKSSGSLQTGDVVIEMTPIGIKNGKFEIGISANTHSVDLTQFDLMQQTVLEYSNKEAKPVSAPALNEHHSSGTLIFNLNQQPASFRIIINDIPTTEKRVFEWP